MAKKKEAPKEVKAPKEKTFEERTGVRLVRPADTKPAIVPDPGNGKTFDERTSSTPPWAQDEAKAEEK